MTITFKLPVPDVYLLLSQVKACLDLCMTKGTSFFNDMLK